PIRGKTDRLVPHEGELFRWQIAELLPRFCPGLTPVRAFSPDDERKYMPSVAGLPENCPYTPVFEMLRGLSTDLGLHPVYVVDPGCAVKISTPPFEMLDVKYSMGSSIGIASGLVLAGVTDPVVAVIGDSDFFHLAVNALFNAAHHRTNILVLVLDNATTALSGFQPTPGLSIDALGHETPALSIERIVEACPVDLIRTIDPWDADATRDALRTGLTSPGLRVLVFRSPCPYIETKFCPGYRMKDEGQRTKDEM
ncbi:MAG: hypothetical protein HY710_09475, partial [Candidatus Latescibacteria bacterium]|nr:hypothetical protein [Candidatus Latescibacterota bacterium]